MVLAYLNSLVFFVYKDMHFFTLVTMSSSSSVPVNVFFWSYPAVTEHYKVFHASMRKSINQLVFRAHDTYRWHGSGFRPRSTYSQLSVNMKKVQVYIISGIDLESGLFIFASFSNLLPAVVTTVILIFVSTFITEFLTVTNTNFKQAPEMYQSMSLILTPCGGLLPILHTHLLEHSSKISSFCI